jgi:hypothetical protein
LSLLPIRPRTIYRTPFTLLLRTHARKIWLVQIDAALLTHFANSAFLCSLVILFGATRAIPFASFALFDEQQLTDSVQKQHTRTDFLPFAPLGWFRSMCGFPGSLWKCFDWLFFDSVEWQMKNVSHLSCARNLMLLPGRAPKNKFMQKKFCDEFKFQIHTKLYLFFFLYKEK